MQEPLEVKFPRRLVRIDYPNVESGWILVGGIPFNDGSDRQKQAMVFIKDSILNDQERNAVSYISDQINALLDHEKRYGVNAPIEYEINNI